MQFAVTIEGTLTTSAYADQTAKGYRFVQFTIIHRVTYTEAGQRRDAPPMYFDVICWGKLAERAQNLTRGDTVVVEASRLMPFDTNGEVGMKLTARNIAVSMRYAEAHAGPVLRQRSGDLVTTAHGETIAAEKYPDVVGDRELVHPGT